MTISRLSYLLICCGLLVSSIKIANCQEEEEERVYEFIEENEQCLKCHKQSNYYYYNEALGDSIKEFMCTQRRIDSTKFYNSVHGTFSCFDCHSTDYTEFPHPGILRLEEPWGCIDCHGYDEEFARFHFEEIQEEFDKSVHANIEDFSCWSCHNPHSYKLYAREDDNIRNVVAYDNSICLSCHSDYDRFQLLTDREEINIIDKHDWLPRQELHFKSIRCIECHAAGQDTILVAHHIKPSEEAVNSCVECHSENSILLASLYKYQVKQQRNEYGFLNAPLVEDYYVIGATRNYYLNVASAVIFGIILLIIIIHATRRKKSKKEYSRR